MTKALTKETKQAQRYQMAAVSLAMVFAIGFFMQNGTTVQGISSATVQNTQQTARSDAFALTDITLTVGAADPTPAIAETSAPSKPVNPTENIAETSGALQLDQLVSTAPFEDLAPPLLEVEDRACDPAITLTAQTGAMVLISLDAPCLPGQRVTLHHNGLMFTHLTDANGQLVVTAPALSDSAVFIADLGNGDGAVGHVMVPDMGQYERAAAQWRGDLGISLHAHEFGADHGEEGHVWSGALSTTEAEGQMILLGDRDLTESYRAEVYTVPVTRAESGNVQLSVEAEVTATNCNRDIQAEAIQWHPSGQLEVRELSLAVPGCDTVGDFLLLKNLLQDLKLAAR